MFRRGPGSAMRRSVREAGQLSQQGLGNVPAWDGVGDEAQPAGVRRRLGGKETQKSISLNLGTCFVSWRDYRHLRVIGLPEYSAPLSFQTRGGGLETGWAVDGVLRLEAPGCTRLMLWLCRMWT
jgi:hypothetical protein